MLSSVVATQVLSKRMQGLSEALRGLSALQPFSRCHIEATPTFYSCSTSELFRSAIIVICWLKALLSESQLMFHNWFRQ